jgi:serine/threonine protein kinase
VKFEIKDNILFIDDKKFILANFCFCEDIGGGGNAKVYLAYNKLLNRKEAVKVWKPKKYQQKVDGSRFLEEVKKNANISLQNVASFYDANVRDGIYYARLEYIPGQTLKKFLLEPQHLVFRYSILETILKTMMLVYEKGYYHGDLHTENIIINERIPYIIDFGTSAFSGVTASRKRDCCMLIELCFKILPELQKLKFIDTKKVKEQGSEMAAKFLLRCLIIIWDFENSSTLELDRYAYRAWRSRFHILIEDFPFVNEDDINEFFNENYSIGRK